MNNTILKELNIIVCECGLLLQLDKAKKEQYNLNAIRQRVRCPYCRRILWEEK